MKKRNIIRKIIDSMDLKSIILTIVIIGGLCLLGYFALVSKSEEPDYVSRLKLKTKGMVYSMENIETISQGRYGQITVLLGVKVKYIYKVNGIEYRGEQYIKNKTGNMKTIIDFRDKMNQWYFSVKYSLTNPDLSYLTNERQE